MMMETVLDDQLDTVASRIVENLKQSAFFILGQLANSARRLNLPLLHIVILDGLARAQSPLTTTELADSILGTKQQVNHAIAELHERGLVESEPLDDDETVSQVRLTLAGRDAAWIADPFQALRTAVSTLPDVLQIDLFFGLFGAMRELQQAGAMPEQRQCASCRHFTAAANSDPAVPHHCDFIESPIGVRHLQQNCPAHSKGSPYLGDVNWTRLANSFVSEQKKE